MLTTSGPGPVVLPPPSRAVAAYAYLLRVPLATALVFVLLPYVSTETAASALLIGLFDIAGVEVFAVATSAFMLALTLMTTTFLVLAYSDERAGARSFAMAYPIRTVWYGATSLLALPTLIAAYRVGDGPAAAFAAWSAAGFATALTLYRVARIAVNELDRVTLLRRLAKWFASRPGLAAGYVDLATARFLPGHRLAASLMAVSAAIYGFIGRQMGDPDGLAVPTLAYVLLLLIILCWALGGLAFLLDRYRVPTLLPLALLVIATGSRGGSDHYFAVSPSLERPPVAPLAALTARRSGAQPAGAAIVVAANGGGIQSAAWTARVLTGLEDVCRTQLGPRCGFAESVRLISGVSGGAVGAMYVAASYVNGMLPAQPALGRVVEWAERSSLEHVGWGLLYRDLFRPLYPHQDFADRGTALEDAWQRDVDLGMPLESWRSDAAAGVRPAVIFNATISDSGERLLIGTANPPEAPGRRNFERLFPGADLKIVTAARLSAAFPFVSPVARARNSDDDAVHIADGGYYDVYGVASLIDWLDDALRADQRRSAPSVSRVMILQLRGAPPNQEPSGKPRGWFYQVYAPLAAMLGARDTGQLAHNEQELSLFRRAWEGKVAVSSAVFQFCGGSPPLSWHMTRRQKAAIEEQWTAERTHASTRAVMRFLVEADATASTYVPARCTPQPAAAQDAR